MIIFIIISFGILVFFGYRGKDIKLHEYYLYVVSYITLSYDPLNEDVNFMRTAPGIAAKLSKMSYVLYSVDQKQSLPMFQVRVKYINCG